MYRPAELTTPYRSTSTSGNTHLKLNKFQEAVDCYTNAIKLDASNATYFCNRYVCMFMYVLHSMVVYAQYVLDNAVVICIETLYISYCYISKLNRVVCSVSYSIMIFEMAN